MEEDTDKLEQFKDLNQLKNFCEIFGAKVELQPWMVEYLDKPHEPIIWPRQCGKTEMSNRLFFMKACEEGWIKIPLKWRIYGSLSRMWERLGLFRSRRST